MASEGVKESANTSAGGIATGEPRDRRKSIGIRADVRRADRRHGLVPDGDGVYRNSPKSRLPVR